MTNEHRQVRVKPETCQPRKVGLEEPFVIRKADGTTPPQQELARAALAPATIIEDPDAWREDWDYSL